MTERARRLIENTGWLAGGEILQRLIGFAIALYLARVLGAAGYGAIGIAIAIASILSQLVSAGTGPGAVRAVARRPREIPQIYARITGLRVVVGVVLVLSAAALLPVLAERLSVPAAVLMTYSISALATAITAMWALRGLEKMNLVAVATLLERAVLLVGLLLFVRTVETPLVVVAVCEGVAIGGLALWSYRWVAKRHGPLRPRFAPSAWGGMWSESISVTLSRLFRLVYSQGPVLMLGWLASPASAGAFLVSHKLVLTFTLIAVVLQQAVYPETSRLVVADRAGARRLQTVVFRYTLTLMTPAIVGGVLAPEAIIRFVFGGEYIGAAAVLRLMVLTLPVIAYVSTLAQLLLAASRPRRLAIGTGVGAAVHILLAVMLIPSHGASGAALACLIGEVAGALALTTLVRGSVAGIHPDRGLLAPVGGAVAMVAVWLLLPGDRPLLGLAMAGVGYAATALALGALHREELREIIGYLRDPFRSSDAAGSDRSA